MIMEIIKDPSLFRAIREEISQAAVKGRANSESLNCSILASLSLLQSVYTEVLRLHVGILVTRTSIEPVTIAGYNLPKGSILQAPTGLPEPLILTKTFVRVALLSHELFFLFSREHSRLNYR